VTWADFNNDGLLDALASGRAALNWFRNEGNGTMTKMSPVFSDDLLDTRIATTCDVDNDGFIDVIFNRQEDGTVNYYRNNGNETFSIGQSPYVAHTDVNGPYIMICKDFNNDGLNDLTFLNWVGSGSGPGGAIYMYRNVNGNFVASGTLGPVYAGNSLVSGDFDKDGYLDIAFSHYYATARNIQSELVVCLNNKGLGTPFAWLPANVTSCTQMSGGEATIFYGRAPGWLVVGDMNNDNYVDLVYSAGVLATYFDRPYLPGLMYFTNNHGVFAPGSNVTVIARAVLV
jgi:hypothetical protein